MDLAKMFMPHKARFSVHAGPISFPLVVIGKECRMVNYVDHTVGKCCLVVSVPTLSDKTLEDELVPPPGLALTDDEIAEAMTMAGAAMGIDGLAPDLSKIMKVSVAHPRVPNRLLLTFYRPRTVGWYSGSFDEGDGRAELGEDSEYGNPRVSCACGPLQTPSICSMPMSAPVLAQIGRSQLFSSTRS
jgi:hypothetical protein